MSNKHKHLEFLQGAINRMAGNLFFLKGWTVTLIAALFALAAKDANRNFVYFAYFPILVFWLLDGYFLSQERRFRALYDHVRTRDESNIDFSMNTEPFKKLHTWPAAMLSRTLATYYVSLAIMLLVLAAAVK